MRDAGYRNLEFFLTNRLELTQRTGKIFTARSCHHGKTIKSWVEHELMAIPVILDDFGALLAAVVDVLVTLFIMRSPVVTILSTVKRAPAGGPGAQPGDARNQSPLWYASAVCF